MYEKDSRDIFLQCHSVDIHDSVNIQTLVCFLSSVSFGASCVQILILHFEINFSLSLSVYLLASQILFYLLLVSPME